MISRPSGIRFRGGTWKEATGRASGRAGERGQDERGIGCGGCRAILITYVALGFLGGYLTTAFLYAKGFHQN